MRGEHSQVEREIRYLGCKESRSRATPYSKVRTTSARKSRKSSRQKNLVEVSSKTAVSMGMREEERKQRELDGAGG
eukprot:6208233-Pleurochrysis_carterae.AAC.5